jgi:NAD(P)-dependent dehydrogenase (short-subunit alcohol dehydrogenase family)
MKQERKLIVITGVSRGLGHALALEFLARGHVVTGCSRTESAEIRKAFPDPHLFGVVDVSDAAAVSRWAELVTQKFGTPDLLINNAALINKNAPLWEVASEEFGKVIDVNIKGVFNVIRAFVPGMIRGNRGVIVNFSSGWGRSTSPEVAPYCATKWAIEGLTQALAQEVPAGLAAIPLNPGVIDTAMLRSCFGGSAAGYPKPEAWAKNAVPFLLSLGPRHNGQSLTVPGIPVD